MPTEPGAAVTLVISSLLCGGAERVAVGMADYWSRHGRTVTLVTLFSADLDFYAVPDGARRIDLGLTGKSQGLLAALRTLPRLRHALRTADAPVVVSYMTRVNILTLLAALGLRTKVIVTEHNDPGEYSLGKAVTFLRDRLYPRADALTVLTRDVEEKWAQPLMPEGRTASMPNFVHLPEEDADAGLPFERPSKFIVAAGRLVPQKGFDLLIEAFADVHRRDPEVVLLILGEGDDRPALERMREDRGLDGFVWMPGTVKDVRPLFSDAELFVFSSRFEGFGNVLIEAMACGTPAVSFDCRSGPSDIIRAGVDGLLVPPEDTRALAGGILELLNDPARREAMGTKAAERAEDFSMDKIMPAWDALVERVVQHGRPPTV